MNSPQPRPLRPHRKCNLYCFFLKLSNGQTFDRYLSKETVEGENMSNYSEQGGILPKVFSCQHQKTSKNKPTRKIYLTSKGRICYILGIITHISHHYKSCSTLVLAAIRVRHLWTLLLLIYSIITQSINIYIAGLSGKQ